MKKIVVLSGAGISAESGLKTFRDNDGLWEGHSVQEVATPEAWSRDPEVVLRFYNERRRALKDASPNAAHAALAGLEKNYDVHIVTQNVDDLHERGGSSRVLHLHGELRLARSELDADYIIDLDGGDIALGDCCPSGGQLRPHIVWFGESVPAMEEAIRVVERADLLLVIGTSLVVYPAASLLHYSRPGVPICVIDPVRPSMSLPSNVSFIEDTATRGISKFLEQLPELLAP